MHFDLGVLSFSFGWDAAQAMGTFLAAGIAWFQISSLKRQQKGWETLKACERYESDPILDTSLRNIKKMRDAGELASMATAISIDIRTVLNYLDGIAIGVRQGFYDESIVRDHLEPIMRFHFNECFDHDVAKQARIQSSDYSRLRDLIGMWDAQPTHFGG
jgi:hypothetical protein